MGLSKLWAKGPDGSRGFVFSHVKTIYYNWAQKKLLSTKLDEIDALIDQKIAKAMMSNVQVNDQNKVPTSALAYAMQQQITENEDAISVLNSERVRRYIDIENQEKFIGFVVNEYDPSILINPVSEYIRLQYKDIDTTYKIYDYGLWGNWENGKDIVSDLNIIKKKISFYAYGSETLNSPF